MSNMKYTWLQPSVKLYVTRTNYTKNQKFAKNSTKLRKTHGANSRPNKPCIEYFLIHLNPCLTIKLGLWRLEIFPKCSVVPTPLGYICIQLINQTSDFHEIFSANSENVTLCSYDLILINWATFQGYKTCPRTYNLVKTKYDSTVGLYDIRNSITIKFCFLWLYTDCC